MVVGANTRVSQDCLNGKPTSRVKGEQQEQEQEQEQKTGAQRISATSSSATKQNSSAATSRSTKTYFSTLLVFLLSTAVAGGLFYAQAASGDLDNEAKTVTMKNSASVRMVKSKSNRSRTDDTLMAAAAAADAAVTAKPTYRPPTDAPTSLPTKLLRTTQPPTTQQPSEAPKQQEQQQEQQQQQQDQVGDDADADAPPKIQVYSTLRNDRSGAAIHDMLYAHAYAYAHGMQYMGACSNVHRYKKAHRKLLNVIGLNGTLPIACPPPPPPPPPPAAATAAAAGNTSTSNQVVFLESRQYRKDSYLRNEPWLQHIRSAVRCTRPAAAAAAADNNSADADGAGDNDVVQIAVHIRRGDVTPCPVGKVSRYTPNSQYMNVLEQYLPHDSDSNSNSDTQPKVHVSIFSEKASHESFGVFAEKNYSLHLDTPIEEVWRALVTADVVIMGRSSFSFAPTLLNGNATVWYTPFWHSPLPGWQNVSDEILEKGSADLREIQETLHCK
jgi:hypothetical protein